MNTSQQISFWFLVTWRKLDLPISPSAVLSQEIPFEKRIRVLVISLQKDRQAMRQAPWHSGHTNSGANLDSSQMHQVGMYMKSTQGSPTSILGAGKVDPFRRYPLDANKYEEETGLFERYQSQDLTIKFSYQYHENLLHQFNICQASVMCFRPSDAQINASFSAMMIEG
jgi:hypothetical protein